MSVLYPLRSELGGILRAGNTTVRTRGIPPNAVELIHAASIAEILAVDHRTFFPILTAADGAALAKPVKGLGVIPASAVTDHYDLPMGSFFAIRIRPAHLAGSVVPPDAQVSLELELGKTAVIGGVGMLGHPFLPRDPDALGSDFGLPKEVSLTAGSERYARFVDAQPKWIQQRPFGSGALRFYQPPKMRTDRLLITLGDLPLLTTAISWPSGQTELAPGLLIAALFVYVAAPGIRHLPVAAAGLSAVQVPKIPPPVDGGTGWSRFFHGCDMIAPTSGSDGQAFYTMASAAAPLSGSRLIDQAAERWRSPPLQEGAALDMYVTQGEEFVRTLAALALEFEERPAGVSPRLRLTVEIWSIDPDPDQPPITAPDAPGAARARVLLAQEHVDQNDQISLVRFRRPVMAGTLLVRLINASAESGVIALRRLKLMCSTGPAITARPVHRQRVDMLHYRLTGQGLADDYGRIGDRTARLTVTYEDGRGGAAVLMRAESILDLVRSGAQLLANSRHAYDRKAVHTERAVTLHSDEVRESGTGREAWRASKMGDKVTWADRVRPVPPGHDDAPSGPFHSYGSSETRTQTELVGHETAGQQLAAVGGILEMVGLPADRMGFRQTLDADGINLLDNLPPRLLEEDVGHQVSWGSTWGGMSGLGYIGLVKTFTLPAYFHQIDDITEVIAGIGGIVAMPGSIQTALEDPIAAAGQMASELQPVLQFINGAVGATIGSISFSLGGQMVAGGSVSISLGSFMPSLSSSSAEGTTGSIAKAANRSVHSHSQSLDTGFDHAISRTRITSADSTRRVELERDEEASEQARRRGVEVHWHDERTDIITGSLSLGIGFPAVADEVYDTLDRLLHVRIDQDPDDDVQIDVWFDVTETLVQEDE